MIRKIKEYFEIRKLRRNAKTLLLVNGAEIISSLQNIAATIETFVNTQSNVIKSISNDDLSKIINFANEITTNPDLKDKMYEKIHDDAQKLREMELEK